MNASNERKLLEDVATIKARMLSTAKCEEHRVSIWKAITLLRIGMAVILAGPPIVGGTYAVLRALKVL